MKTCVKCGRERSEKFMQEAVFLNFVGTEPAGIWKCASNETCKQERKSKRREEDNRGGQNEESAGSEGGYSRGAETMDEVSPAMIERYKNG